MSQAPAVVQPRILPMSRTDIGKVRALEQRLMQCEQVPIVTRHVFHAGMYARTLRIPAGVVLTGAEIKRATLLIISGHASVFIGGEAVEILGYRVIPASAGRKQLFTAHADTDLTMVFPTAARAVTEAEAEFTDEADLLFSRTGENEVVMTGD